MGAKSYLMSKSQLAKAAMKTAETIANSQQNDQAKNASFDFLLRSVRILGIVALSVTLPDIAAAQNAKKDATGNYVAIATTKKAADPVNTGKTFTTAKGETFPVYTGAKGALFILRTSKKTGVEYRQYLKLEK